MREKLPGHKTEKALSPEEQHRLEQEKLFLADYPLPERNELSTEQCAEEIRKFEALCADFEQTHNLSALNEVQLYTGAEARACTIREAAKEDMSAIVSLMHHLERQTLIPKDILEGFYTRYELFDAAIGTLTQDGLDHSIRKIRGRH